MMINMRKTLFWIFTLCVGLVRCFNIDLEVPVFHAGPNNSMFGFSVSLHRDRNQDWLLVGAPTTQTSVPGVVNGGAVFKCKSDGSEPCSEVEFDRRSSAIELVDGEYMDVEEKSHRWLGATVKSSGADGHIVACAPRHTYYYYQPTNYFPMGTCFLSEGDLDRLVVREYSPCRELAGGTARWDQLGNCLGGLSADIAKSDIVLLGAPGSYSWQGQIYVNELLDTDRVFNTFESNNDINYNGYMGYSVAIGEFGDGRIKEYVAGAPRGNELRGVVKIYNQLPNLNLRLLEKFDGEQFGSYFGASVCVADVNGDGLHDVVVGAPFYTIREQNIEKWEAGRVYVYYQQDNNKFTGPDRITGPETTARFGSAVAAIGDVNQDGYNDIAVGAPYHEDDEKGAVYIYHGSNDGLRLDPAQVITPSDIGVDLRTFGSSLAGGLDMDKNRYPDILVGAYSDDQVVLLRSRPVVSIEATITMTPQNVDLEVNCDDGSGVPCFNVNVCFKHTGVNVPTTLEIKFTCTLDSYKQLHKRAYFAGTSSFTTTQTIKLESPGTDWCSGNRKVYLRDEFSDKYSPIGVDIKYNLPDSQFSPTDVRPVLNGYIPDSITKEMQILLDCGPDGVCYPDLHLTAELDRSELFIGSGNEVNLKVKVVNLNEDSFESEVHVQIPPGFDFVRVKKTDTSEYQIACFDNPMYENTVTCSVGNPLRASHGVTFDFTMSPVRFVDSDITRINSTDAVVGFYLNASSTNPENNTYSNNHVNLILPIKVNTTIDFTGMVIPDPITYDPKQRAPGLNISREEDIGPQVNFVYKVHNVGPSSINGANINIKWPAFTASGEHLLYLVDVKMRDGTKCVYDGELNPEKLTMKKTPSVRRMKREDDAAKLPLKQDCQEEGCINIYCPINFVLPRGGDAFVDVQSRLWKETLIKGGHDKSLITSTATVQVTSFPYRLKSLSYPTETLEITTSASTMKPKSLPVPIWVIILAILAGLLILLCLILVLWKAGFFKRKRVEDEYKEKKKEKEPIDTGDVPDVYIPPTAVVVKDEYKENVENEDRDSVLTDPEYENVVKPSSPVVAEPVELDKKPVEEPDTDYPDHVVTGPPDDTEYLNIVEIDPDLMVETPEEPAAEPAKADSTSDLIANEEKKEDDEKEK